MIRRLLLRLAGHHCAAPAAVPFARAVLCLDCDHVSASRGDTCGRCGSTGALMPLWSAQLPIAPLAERSGVIPFHAGRRRR
jgi:hypothetical protein